MSLTIVMGTCWKWKPIFVRVPMAGPWKYVWNLSLRWLCFRVIFNWPKILKKYDTEEDDPYLKELAERRKTNVSSSKV